MASSSQIFVVSALLLAVFVYDAYAYTAGFEMSEVEAKAAAKSSTRCSKDFSKVDFAEVTSVCKGPEYHQEFCCAAFKKMACKYPEQVNDFSTTCPVEFMAYLNYAGSYPNGVFVGRCNTGSALCS